mgnify:CR=1 FL=1
MKTLGILGGGQLGKMIALSACYRGYRCIVLDPSANCPASVAANVLVGDFNDRAKIEELCRQSDVVTYEFENIPAAIVEEMAQKYNVPQGSLPLKLSQDRYLEKSAVNRVGVRTADFQKMDTVQDLQRFAEAYGYPFFVKTRSLGYDGHGQVVVHGQDELPLAAKLVAQAPCIAESFVDFACEISQIAVRGLQGEFSFFPVPHNVHKDGILRISAVPSDVSAQTERLAAETTRRIMEGLNIYGILAVEYFVTKQGEILFNEMAPRPHNSGHYTIEGCVNSQYDQLVRCLMGEKLGSTQLLAPVVMVNVLGQHVSAVERLKQTDAVKKCKIHDYGKSEARHNRKMGHLTFVDCTLQEVENILKEIDYE